MAVCPSLDHVCGFFFFLSIGRPPRSTLFPTRRSSDLGRSQSGAASRETLGPDSCAPSGEKCQEIPRTRNLNGSIGVRSEEHTSELQSRQYLVCRLLLEKKKNTDITMEEKDTEDTLRGA